MALMVKETNTPGGTMGAHSFVEYSKNPDAQAAYNTLSSNAAFEDGNSAYSGTIATTRGFRIATPQLVTQAHANEIMEARLSGLSKWEACEALQIGTPRKTKTKTVTVKGLQRVAGVQDVANALGVDVSMINKISVISCKSKFVTTTEAPSASKVWVVSVSGRERTFASKAEANAHIKALIVDESTQRWVRAEQRYSLYQRSSVSTITATLAHVETKVEVEMAAGPLSFSSWMFYGWAAS
jgi:hypothetical protein